jgi:hypothetical protein
MPIRQRATLLLMLAAITLTSCSRQRVLVGPMVDLKTHVRIGLVTFTAQGAKGSLASFATQRFNENLLRAQPGIEILEIGVVEGPVDAAMAKKLGEQHNVKTLITGHLVVSDVKPRVTILGGVSASAEATLSLATRLMSAESGSTLWSQSSRVRETIAAFSMVGGIPVFDAQDPADAYGNVVNQLVWTLTQDFRSTWVKQ